MGRKSTGSKRGKRPAKSNKSSNQPPKRKARNRKMPGIKTLGFVAAFGLASVAVGAAYRDNYKQSTDLGVIGNGMPTVVQVHDPGCKLCRALKANTHDALRPFKDDIQYRIADIGTSKGRSFAASHEVQHVTLITFSGSGKVVDKLHGVREAESLAPYFERLVKRNKAVQRAKQSTTEG